MNCWVTDTNDTPGGVEDLDRRQSRRASGQPVDLVDDHDIDPAS